ncbi:MAG: DUF2341 domain-containing protein [Deltaproteobacteria bacterium]|nr:DUF2341 domain-containing protein [Deltaproteobacteria bacterium]
MAPLAAALMLTSCPVELPVNASIAFPCDSDQDCLSGQVCRGHLCLYADAGAGHRDAGAPDLAGRDLASRDLAGADLNQPDGAGFDRAPIDAGAWWNADWHRRRKLTFDNAGRNETLLDFPVLVKLDDSRIDYDRTTGDGIDVRFVDADGSELYFQLESWIPDDTSWFWVKVPRIEALAANDFIWLYYDNPGATARSEQSLTWSGGYQAVYNMHYNFYDSSGHIVDPAYDNRTGPGSGQIAGARTFDGTESWIDLGDNLPILQSVSAVTLSAWIHPNRLVAEQTIVAIGVHSSSAPTPEARAFLSLRNSSVAVGGRASDSEGQRDIVGSSRAVEAGGWYHVVGVIDFASGEASLYVNSVRNAQGPLALAQSATANTTASNGAIGARADGQSQLFSGIIDDVRVSGVARSGIWIGAEYENQALDSFIDYGGEESR